MRGFDERHPGDRAAGAGPPGIVGHLDGCLSPSPRVNVAYRDICSLVGWNEPNVLLGPDRQLLVL
jgi:hypothetical protein